MSFLSNANTSLNRTLQEQEVSRPHSGKVQGQAQKMFNARAMEMVGLVASANEAGQRTELMLCVGAEKLRRPGRSVTW